MARDPMTAEEFEQFREAMDEQREELLRALAQDLGGEPDDYRVGKTAVPDGSK